MGFRFLLASKIKIIESNLKPLAQDFRPLNLARCLFILRQGQTNHDCAQKKRIMSTYALGYYYFCLILESV